MAWKVKIYKRRPAASTLDFFNHIWRWPLSLMNSNCGFMDLPLYEKIANQIETQVSWRYFLTRRKDILSSKSLVNKWEVSFATCDKPIVYWKTEASLKHGPSKRLFRQENFKLQPTELQKLNLLQNDGTIIALLRRWLHASQDDNIIQILVAAIPKSQFLPHTTNYSALLVRLMRLEPEICALTEVYRPVIELTPSK